MGWDCTVVTEWVQRMARITEQVRGWPDEPAHLPLGSVYCRPEVADGGDPPPTDQDVADAWEMASTADYDCNLVEISLWPPSIAIGWTEHSVVHPERNVHNGVRFGIGKRWEGGLAGLELSVFSTTQGDVHGVALGAMNTIEGSMQGIALDVIRNEISGDANGVSGALLWNDIGHDQNGLALAFGGNIVGGDANGLDVALIGNQTGGTMRGVQVSLGINWARNLAGGQLALGFNFAMDQFRGAQIGLFDLFFGAKDGSFSMGAYFHDLDWQ